MKLNKLIDGKMEIIHVFHFVNPTKTLVAMATRSFRWLIMGKSGSCNNLKTACSFLMKFAAWIDSRLVPYRSSIEGYFRFTLRPCIRLSDCPSVHL